MRDTHCTGYNATSESRELTMSMGIRCQLRCPWLRFLREWIGLSVGANVWRGSGMGKKKVGVWLSVFTKSSLELAAAAQKKVSRPPDNT